MKRILVLTTAYEPAVGGAEIAVQEITKRLVADYSFVILTYRFNTSWPRHEARLGGQIEIWRLGFGTRVDRLLLFPFLVFFKAWQLNRKMKFDLLWAVMVSYASIGGYFLKRYISPNTPFLLTLQEGDSEQHLHMGKLGLVGVWWNILVRAADRIQAISRFLADYARSLGTTVPIDVVPNGVAVEHFGRTVEGQRLQVWRQRFGLAETDQIIITVSRLVEKNAVDISILSLEHLPQQYKLLIVGDGSQKNDLERLVQSHGLSNRVIFARTITHEDLPVVLRLASVFVRPSRSEGLGNVFLEAMAAGMPVVCTDVGGIKDFLRDRQTGLVVKPDDPADLAEKIKLLFSDKDLYRRLQHQGRTLVAEHYSWDRVAGEMKRIFDEVR